MQKNPLFGNCQGESIFLTFESDKEGNLYVLISYRGEITFDDKYKFITDTMSIIIIKYNEKNEIIWVKEIGKFIDLNAKRNFKTEGDRETVAKIKIDDMGGIHILGRFLIAFRINCSKLIDIKMDKGLYYIKLDINGKIEKYKYIFGLCTKFIQLLVNKYDVYILGTYMNKLIIDEYVFESSRNIFIAKLINNKYQWIKDLELDGYDSVSQAYDIIYLNDKLYIIGSFSGKLYIGDYYMDDNINKNIPKHYMKYFIAIITDKGTWIGVRTPQWTNECYYEFPQQLFGYNGYIYIATYSIDCKILMEDDEIHEMNGKNGSTRNINLLIIKMDEYLNDIEIKKFTSKLSINYLFEIYPILFVSDKIINVLTYFTYELRIEDIKITTNNNFNVACIKIQNDQVENIKTMEGFDNNNLQMIHRNTETIIGGTINGIFKSDTFSIQTLSKQFLIIFF